MRALVCFIAVAVLSQSPPSHAGGPLRFNSAGPVTWDIAQPIKYKVDRGALGGIAGPAARALVDDAFAVWTDVAAAAITFQADGQLPSDVKTAVEYSTLESDDDGPNIVVFDTAGDIIAALAGPQNRFRIIGWANPVTNASGNQITRFYSLMNGAFAFDGATFLSTLVHEFGHAVGMDHSQIHAAFATNGIGGDDAFIPTMFPTNADDDTHLGSLNPDDMAWIAMLYKEPSFDQKYGLVKGRLVRGQTPVRGANVVIVRADGDNESALRDRFSCVSDWLTRNDGEFVIPAEPGKYKVLIEPILPKFTAGSSVGPLAETSGSPSFVNPVQPKEFATEVTVKVGHTEDVGVLDVNQP